MHCPNCDKSYGPAHSRCPACNSWLRLSAATASSALPHDPPEPEKVTPVITGAEAWMNAAAHRATASDGWAQPGQAVPRAPIREAPGALPPVVSVPETPEPTSSRPGPLVLAGLATVVVGFVALTLARKPAVVPQVAVTSAPTLSVGEQFLVNADRNLKAGNFEAAARELDDAYSVFSAQGDAAKTRKIAAQRKEARLKLARQHLQLANKALKSHDAIRAAAQAEAAATIYRSFGGPRNELAQALTVKRAAEVTRRSVQTSAPEPGPTAAVEMPSIDKGNPGYRTRSGGVPGRTPTPTGAGQPIQSQPSTPGGPAAPLPPPPPDPETPQENWRDKLHKDDAQFKGQ